MLEYFSTKTYDHNEGLSCAFRQWKADHSHCSLIHGYALSVKLTFRATELDDRNWVVDFGGLKNIKEFLKDTFDHTTAIAEDDPELATFRMLHKKGIIDLRVLPGVGCEKFAEYIYEHVSSWLVTVRPGVILKTVEVREHSANSSGVINKA